MYSTDVDTNQPRLELDLSATDAAEDVMVTHGLGSNFRRLFVATASSNLSDGLRAAALPLLATSVTRDAVAVAGVYFAGQLPWLLFGLPAGALVDRMDRRRLLVLTHAFRVGVVALLALAALTGSVTLTMLYAVAFVLGSAETVFDNAAQALLPALVPESKLEHANGRLELAYLGGNQLVGPAAGAALFAVAASAPFVLDTVALVVTTLAVLLIRPSIATDTAARSTEQTSLRSDVAEGLRWLLHNRSVRALTLLGTGINFCVNATIAVMVLYALDVLDIRGGAYGMFLAVYAVGGMAGGLVAARVSQRLGKVRAIRTCIVAAGVVLIAMGLFDHPLAAAAAFMALGVVATVWNVMTLSMRQALTPAALLGRVIGGHRLLSWGGGALGAIAGGVVARYADVPTVFISAGAGALALGLVARRLMGDEDEARAVAPSPAVVVG